MGASCAAATRLEQCQTPRSTAAARLANRPDRAWAHDHRGHQANHGGGGGAGAWRAMRRPGTPRGSATRARHAAVVSSAAASSHEAVLALLQAVAVAAALPLIRPATRTPSRSSPHRCTSAWRRTRLPAPPISAHTTTRGWQRCSRVRAGANQHLSSPHASEASPCPLAARGEARGAAGRPKPLGKRPASVAQHQVQEQHGATQRSTRRRPLRVLPLQSLRGQVTG